MPIGLFRFTTPLVQRVVFVSGHSWPGIDRRTRGGTPPFHSMNFLSEICFSTLVRIPAGLFNLNPALA